MLSKPEGTAMANRVQALLDRLTADPANQFAKIASAADIKAMGGNPQAAFYVQYNLNAYAGGVKGKVAPLAAPSTSKGTHGYFANETAMRSSFMMMGRGIAKGRNLGGIDMRTIAAVLAKLLAAKLPIADFGALP